MHYMSHISVKCCHACFLENQLMPAVGRGVQKEFKRVLFTHAHAKERQKMNNSSFKRTNRVSPHQKLQCISFVS